MNGYSVKLLLVLAGIACVLFAGEVLVRFGGEPKHEKQNKPDAPLHIRCSESYLYQLNPAHPEISAQGFRDREYPLKKPDNATRILVLGDSVTYGMGVDRDDVFSEVLERSLMKAHLNVEILNTGVSAYTPYNEMQFYIEKGRRFQADIVIAALCLNDVADPLLHWKLFGAEVTELPSRSIPNPERHYSVIRPYLEKISRSQDSSIKKNAVLEKSALFKWIKKRAEKLFYKDDDRRYEYIQGIKWPIIITGEDILSIRVLMDYQSPEWKWLRTMYDRLYKNITADGAELIVVLLPLSYQLEAGYPYVPQTLLKRYFSEKGVPCLDLLEPFRKQAEEDLFLGKIGNSIDYWHFNENGHRLAAEQIEQFLCERGFLVQH